MEFVGPINSIFIQCSQKTGQQLRLNKKKKRKKGENTDAARLSAIQAYTTRTFSILSNDKCNY